jgi:uncharacterized protein
MTQTTKALAPFRVKSLDEGERTFTGLASTWDLDLGLDVIHPGAFKRTLREWKSSGRVMPLIDQHNYGSIRSVVGKMRNAKETDAGLLAEFQIIGGPDGDEVLRRVKGGYVDGLSIGYEPQDWEMEGEVRHLKQIKLHEVSVVIWPMNPGATIDTATVKAMLKHADPATLTDADRKELRRVASTIGQLLRTDPAPASAAPEDAKAGSSASAAPSPEAAPPEATEAPDTSLLDRLLLARIGARQT